MAWYFREFPHYLGECLQSHPLCVAEGFLLILVEQIFNVTTNHAAMIKYAYWCHQVE